MADEIKLSKGAQRVFDYMIKNNGITTLDAVKDLGCTRLSARIFEMRKKGVNVSSELVKVFNRFGEHCWIKKYFIG